MNRLKSLIVLAATALPMTCLAGDFPWLTFRLTDGSGLSVAADNLTITYSNRVLQLKSATVDREIPVDEVKTMQFTSSSSALNAVTDDRLSGAMPFYDISGKSVGSYESVDEARLCLPSGVYILKSGDKTVKVIF